MVSGWYPEDFSWPVGMLVLSTQTLLAQLPGQRWSVQPPGALGLLSEHRQPLSMHAPGFTESPRVTWRHRRPRWPTQAMVVLCVEVRDSEEGLSPGWMRQEMGALWFSLFLSLHAYELFSSIDVTGHKERIQRLWESVKPASGLGFHLRCRKVWRVSLS